MPGQDAKKYKDLIVELTAERDYMAFVAKELQALLDEAEKALRECRSLTSSASSDFGNEDVVKVVDAYFTYRTVRRGEA